MSLPKHDDETTQTIIVLTEGTMVFHYQIIQRLGRGGMGEVYLANDTKLKRRVALKFLLHQYSDDEKALARFKHEAEATAKFDHPNLVTVYEVNNFDNRPFLAMQYIPGETLRDYIQKRRLGIDEVIELAKPICEGLIEAHSQMVVHRDLKPANILIDEKGRPKIVDFGIALLLGDNAFTQLDTVSGTPGYMAPEQMEGQSIDKRADIFSLGVVLYEMVTGQRPFRAGSGGTLMHSILTEEPRHPVELNSQTPDWLNTLILSLLQKNPADRIASATEVLECLSSRSLDGLEMFQARIGVRERRKKVTVLNLKNFSGDKSWDNLCAGLSDTMVNELKERSGLIVVEQPESELPKDLKRRFAICRTDFIVEGSLISWKQKIRLSLLIHAEDREIPLASYNYDGSDDEIFELLQRAIEESSDALVEITTATTFESPSKPTMNLAAYKAYLMGCKFNKTHKPEDLDLAENKFKGALELDPNMALAHTGLAHVYISRYSAFHDLRAETILAAKREAEKALELMPNLPDALRALGRFYMETNKFGEAEKVLMKAVRQDPKFALGYRTLAWLKLRTGDLSQALRWAKKAGEESPNDPETLLLLSLIQIDSRNLGAAYATLERAIELAPDFGRAYYNLGIVYIKSGKLELALEKFLMAIKYQGDPNSYIDAGYVYLLQGKFSEARQMFNKSIENKHITFLAQYYLGLTEKLAGNAGLAIKQFEQVLIYLENQDLPEGYAGHMLAIKAKALASMGEKQKAREILGQFSIENVSSGEVLYFLARAYAILNDTENYKIFLHKSIQESGGPTEKEAALDPHFSAEPD